MNEADISTGQISAIVKYLVNAGRGPKSPSHWCRPDDFGLEPVDGIFPDSGIDLQHIDTTDLLHDFGQSLDLQQWPEAALLNHGAGLEQGADNDSLRRLVSRLRAGSRGHQLAELTLAI
eukprot:8401922-Pyramimonas_sp.AAC.1